MWSSSTVEVVCAADCHHHVVRGLCGLAEDGGLIQAELVSMTNATTGGDLELSEEDGYRDEPDVLIT